MDRYTARINSQGNSQRQRYINRLVQQYQNKLPDNPAYKKVKLNGKETHLLIRSGTKPYYKEFQGLPGQRILAGDYIEWADHTWLVYEADSDGEIYIDGSLRQCQFKLYWQKEDGSIIYRYAWVQNASAYNNGESGNSTIVLQSNQFMVYMSYDEETKLLNNGLRMHMSKENSLCRPYTLTRPDDLTYGYGENGVLNMIFTQAQFNETTDSLVELDTGENVWICNYHSSTHATPPSQYEPTTLFASISGSDTLKCGYPRIYTVQFLDENGIEVPAPNFSWSVLCNFNISQYVNGNTIELCAEDNSQIGRAHV